MKKILSKITFNIVKMRYQKFSKLRAEYRRGELSADKYYDKFTSFRDFLDSLEFWGLLAEFDKQFFYPLS